MTSDRPVLVEVITDSNVPLLPPYITAKQKKNFFTTIMNGEPDAREMIKQIYEEVKDEKTAG
jgi:pyruvate dehydrogenase (quinone)